MADLGTSGQGETNLVRRVTFGRSAAPQFDSFKAGDTVNIHVRVKEGEKERIQQFKGVVIKVQGSGMGRSFTVRKVASGVGVERTFPFSSPALAKIEVLAKGRVRRGRLFYLRGLHGRAARLQSELVRPSGEGKKNAAPKEAKSSVEASDASTTQNDQE